MLQASNRKNAQQNKKAKQATRRLRSIGRALVRELVRKTTQKQISPYAQTLLNAWSILLQNKTDKHKIYSLHEPHVCCISKGKAHKPYEFGTKVSISRTRDSRIVLGALALPGNPYCLEIPTMDIRLKPPLSKSKKSQENSRKS
jgi:IS5 family transposase